MVGRRRGEAPERVIGRLSHCVVNRSTTGGTVTITLQGHCQERGLSTSVRGRIAPGGVLVVKPAKMKGARLTEHLTLLIRTPFIGIRTAGFARINCINHSIRSVIQSLVRGTVRVIRGRGHDSICTGTCRTTLRELSGMVEPNAGGTGPGRRNVGS